MDSTPPLHVAFLKFKHVATLKPERFPVLDCVIAVRDGRRRLHGSMTPRRGCCETRVGSVSTKANKLDDALVSLSRLCQSVEFILRRVFAERKGIPVSTLCGQSGMVAKANIR